MKSINEEKFSSDRTLMMYCTEIFYDNWEVNEICHQSIENLLYLFIYLNFFNPLTGEGLVLNECNATCSLLELLQELATELVTELLGCVLRICFQVYIWLIE